MMMSCTAEHTVSRHEKSESSEDLALGYVLMDMCARHKCAQTMFKAPIGVEDSDSGSSEFQSLSWGKCGQTCAIITCCKKSILRFGAALGEGTFSAARMAFSAANLLRSSSMGSRSGAQGRSGTAGTGENIEVLGSSLSWSSSSGSAKLGRLMVHGSSAFDATPPAGACGMGQVSLELHCSVSKTKPRKNS
jgi:hypothetical protein